MGGPGHEGSEETTMSTILWSPPDDVRQTSRIGAYLRWLADERGLDFAAYDDLWQWSVDDLPGFWRTVADFFQVDAPGPVLNGDYRPGAAFGPGTEFGPSGTWFPHARLNYAEYVLRMPGVADDVPMVFGYSQSREPVIYTAQRLRDEVRKAAAGLKRLGVRPGDRVAAYLPNVPEALVLMLATTS